MMMFTDIKYPFKYREKVVDRLMLCISLTCALIVLFFLGYNTDKAAASLTNRFRVIVLTTIVGEEAAGIAKSDTKLGEGDILVLFSEPCNINKPTEVYAPD